MKPDPRPSGPVPRGGGWGVGGGPLALIKETAFSLALQYSAKHALLHLNVESSSSIMALSSTSGLTATIPFFSSFYSPSLEPS
ncbi:unnamed protein product [Lota lota]